MAECKYHVDHENRITRLEEDMDKCKENLKDPRTLVAIVGFFGVAFSTVGSIAGTILGAYLKSRGLI
jgi:hypothetical protein